MLKRFAHLCLFVSLMSCCCAGCATQEEWDRFWASFEDPGQQPDALPALPSNTRALAGTIGESVTIGGLNLTQVRGYGLVVGLADSGGSDGPDVVKQYLVKEIRRNQRVGGPGTPASELIESRDTAMVEVSGFMPAGAQKGDRFDGVVRALGSQTQSLSGGRLDLCSLKLFARSPQGVIEGKELATASGPVFVSPFNRAGRATSKVVLRTGFVLGAGVVKEPREVRLVLNDPRYSLARQIMNRINSRHGGVEPLADAKNASTIAIEIPDDWKDRKRVFLQRVLHTTVQGSEGFLMRRARDLGDEIEHPDAAFDSIGLAWEGIGKIAMPIITEHYLDENAAARFYAGRTGLRLGDPDGMKIVAKFALNPSSPFRRQAIDELGFARHMHGAAEALRKVLADDDPDTRILAYKSLRRQPNSAIDSRVLDIDNLILDEIDSGGPFLIYVQRLKEPRIALFGRQMRCQPPAQFPGQRRDERFLHLLVTAAKDDDHLTLIYTNKFTGKSSPPIHAPLDVGDLVRLLGDRFDMNDDGEPTGLAVPYSEIVDLLETFCSSRTIPARFVAEESEVPDEEDERARPESEY